MEKKLSLIEPVGALPDWLLKQLIAEHHIKNAHIEAVKPSSLDLTADLTTLKRIPCVFMPSINKTRVVETLKKLNAQPAYRKGETRIEPGVTYVAEIAEDIDLSGTDGIVMRVNPKSSTGRVDLHVQFVYDRVGAYDTLTPNSEGRGYVIIRSKSFPIVFKEDKVSLNQARFFQQRSELVAGTELKQLVQSGVLRNDKKKTDLIFSNLIRRGNRVEMSVDLKDLNGRCAGYVAKKNVTTPLVWEKGANSLDDFFEPIKKPKGDKSLIFTKDRFYILSTRESLRVPPEFACEMVSFDDTLGEFRSHYAGFIDNGWGFTAHRPITLELRANEDMYMYHGQPVAHIVFEKMCAPVQAHYDMPELNSNYTNQVDARLGKFFKTP